MIKSAQFVNRKNGREYLLICHRDMFNHIVVVRYFGSQRQIIAQESETEALRFFDQEVARRKKHGYIQWL